MGSVSPADTRYAYIAILIRGGVQLTHALQMTRAVLSDAIALVRGDRFATTSFTRKFPGLDVQFWSNQRDFSGQSHDLGIPGHNA